MKIYDLAQGLSTSTNQFAIGINAGKRPLQPKLPEGSHSSTTGHFLISELSS